MSDTNLSTKHNITTHDITQYNERERVKTREPETVASSKTEKKGSSGIKYLTRNGRVTKNVRAGLLPFSCLCLSDDLEELLFNIFFDNEVLKYEIDYCMRCDAMRC